MAAIQEHEAGGLGVIRLEPIGIKLGATGACVWCAKMLQVCSVAIIVVARHR